MRLKEAAAALHVRPEDVVDRVKALMEERKQLERQLAEAKKQIALGGVPVTGAGAAAAAGIKTVGKVKLIARTVQGLNPKDLRGLIDDGKKQVGSGIVAIVGVTEDGRAGLAVGVTDDLTKTWNAVDLVRAGAEVLGGRGGGGRPDMAQAGGPDGSRADAALAAIEARLSAAA
jgi:alanyl-tRNA synthetase